ncbi:hydroxyethylthiazole kinase [Anaerovorax odorimutans]|uniref:hydroxyethylthiazole kinase n=1 Tax=Anaerovorax odorimutans TaxID=109327 RepID=UPI0003FB7D5E|nr:hydroxyethylthiazole kinase [Anaerovorax odorimutans]
MFKTIIENVKYKTPLVHCITNYVTVNDCANILIACGGSPIMADDSNEVEDITTICNSLDINLGTLNERTIISMVKAGKKANELNHPIVLDPVGAGASKFRTDVTLKLLEEVKFSVIRGNISEIKTISQGSGTTKGVDADVSDKVTEENLDEAVIFAKKLSDKLNTVIIITGAIDIVACSDKAYIIRNGHAMMSKITGSGCMLTAVIAAYIGANKDNIFDAAAAAVCVMGLCGEIAYKYVEENKRGTSTFRTILIDEMSKINEKDAERGMKIEIR